MVAPPPRNARTMSENFAVYGTVSVCPLDEARGTSAADHRKVRRTGWDGC